MFSVLLTILLLVSMKQADPNQKYLDYLSKSLVDHDGMKMNIKWSQIDGEKSWSQIGVIEILGKKRFFLDTDQQSVKIDNNQITTYYKSESGKIIYDTLIEDSYDIFDFLSGDFSGFIITNSLSFDLIDDSFVISDYIPDDFFTSEKVSIKPPAATEPIIGTTPVISSIICIVLALPSCQDIYPFSCRCIKRLSIGAGDLRPIACIICLIEGLC